MSNHPKGLVAQRLIIDIFELARIKASVKAVYFGRNKLLTLLRGASWPAVLLACMLWLSKREALIPIAQLQRSNTFQLAILLLAGLCCSARVSEERASELGEISLCRY